MLEAFEKASGIHVNFIRFSSGEALARLIAEGNPQVDVLFGGPVETFTAGEAARHLRGLHAAERLPTCRRGSRARRACGLPLRMNPLVFITNTKFLQEHSLQAPASWDDLLNPALQEQCRKRLTRARSGTGAVTRIFSILQVNNRNEDFGSHPTWKKLGQNIQAYIRAVAASTVRSASVKRPGGYLDRRCAVQLRQKGYDVQHSSSQKEGIGSAAEMTSDSAKGNKERSCRCKKLIIGDEPGHAVAACACQRLTSCSPHPQKSRLIRSAAICNVSKHLPRSMIAGPAITSLSAIVDAARKCSTPVEGRHRRVDVSGDQISAQFRARCRAVGDPVLPRPVFIVHPLVTPRRDEPSCRTEG